MRRPLAVLALVGVLVPDAAAARTAARRGFPLFAPPANVLLRGNRVQCNVNNVGELCVDPNNSPVVGGGYWPLGTIDQYIFDGGLQVAAIVAGTDQANFPWPHDTVGAFFFDPRGDQLHGSALTPLFDGLDPRTALSWPNGAYARDPGIFAPALLGRPTVSDQDTWTRFWDVNQLTNGRAHPMGIMVDQRTLSFATPALEDVVFFVYRLVNITARSAAPYQQLAARGFDATEIAAAAALGAAFQDRVEADFQVQVPDNGYGFDSLYVGFGQDPDIGQAGFNNSNMNHVFSTALAWKSDFRESLWEYPPTIFAPPAFAQAPGILAEALLRTPFDPAPSLRPRITMGSNFANGVLPNAFGVQRLWTHLSGNFVPGQTSCSVPNPQLRHFCYVSQTPNDTRYFISSGPSSLAPGEATTLVIAQVHAPAVANGLAPFIGGTMRGGFPLDGVRLALAIDTLRDIDRAAGWVSHGDVNANGRIDASEVQTVPRSLYAKILAAQAALDDGFLVPDAPVAPDMFVVPGDNRATVVWRPSTTETTGDPFFAVASNPASPHYDPSFRQFDVEGYRVWRGRSPATMRPIAQFDHKGSVMADYAGQFLSAGGFSVYGNQCAPELGVTATCPAFPVMVDLSGALVQVRLGDRILLQGGVVAVLRTDTAVSGGASGRSALRNSGVPFVFVDSTARNGEHWLYAVTAFDVNSVRSSWSTMESPMALRSVTPRITSLQEVAGGVGTPLLLGGDSSILNPAAPLPALSAATGIFSGPMPPSDGLSVALQSVLPQLLSSGNLTVVLDSIVPGSTLSFVRPARYYFTSRGSGAPTRLTLDITGDPGFAFNDRTGTAAFPATMLDQAQASRFGGDSTFGLFAEASVLVPGAWGLTMKGRADANAAPTGPNNGPRWWIGSTNENTNDPNGISCANPPPVGNGTFSCVLTDLTRNSGAIPGVGIFGIRSYHTVGTAAPARDLEGVTATVFRAADFQWYWGANGAVDSVVDVTHRVRVPFSPKIRASWGIINDSSFIGLTAAAMPDTSPGRLTWTDQFCVDPIPAYLNLCGGVAQTPAVFQDHARLSPVTFASSTFPNPAQTASAATGNGFMLYLNGHFFLMQTPSLPVAGTVWNARFYSGNIAGTPGTYALQPAIRPPAVPGLRIQVPVQASVFDAAVTTDSAMARIHTVPDPYYLTNSLELGSTPVLRFVNLPGQAVIRIYTSGGVLVQVLWYNDPTGGGEAAWNLRNRGGRPVATGVYFYHVESADGRRKVGRFVIVNGER